MERNTRGHRLISSTTNPLIKRARSLRDKKYRRQEGAFLAEGLRILAEARDAGYLPQQIFYADGQPLHPLAEDVIAAAAARGGEIIATSRDVLAKLSGKDNPQALVGIFAEHALPISALTAADAPLWLVAQAMRDPGNLGTLLRSGDAVAAGGVILIDDCVDPFSVECVRASMGAIFTQKIAVCRWAEFTQWRARQHAQLVAMTLSDDSVDYRAAAFTTPVLLMVGNEAQGLPDAYADAADIRVKLPMLGRADSLNAAVSVSILAYHVRDRLDAASFNRA
ncbi:MAG: RNA methyltransferase [Sphingomonadaceae bacterium]|nr:RNA methyltransferase [Sphingomonadaceae bacterium]